MWIRVRSSSILLLLNFELVFFVYTGLFYPRRGVAQSGSALGWGPSGRWFESSRPDHFMLYINAV